MQLHHHFIKSYKANPQQICVYDQATGKDLTYKQVLQASLLVMDSIPSHDRFYIGIMLPTSAACLISILAVLMKGRVPVMINYSTGAQNNCLFAREKCGFEIILTTGKLLEKLGIQKDEHMILIEDLIKNAKVLSKVKVGLKSLKPDKFVYKGEDTDNSIVLFTSGSEKDPKAVPLSHKNITSNVEGLRERIDFNETDVFMAVLPNFHIYGLTTSLWLPIICGSSIVTQANPLEYETIAKNIKKYRATVLTATPTFFHGYNQKSEVGDFSTLRIAIAGGDKLTPIIRDSFFKKHGSEICEGYGTTETSPVISFNSPGMNKPGSVGKPLFNAKVKIVDLESEEKLGPNRIGKIYVKGDLVMNGYLGDYEESSIRIHAGWYDTGDMGLIDNDGFLWHKGRLKRFVKIGGEMVSLVAIEDKLESLLDEDTKCCLVDIPHPVRGNEIVAVISGDFEEKKIKNELKKMVAPISMPKHFVKIEEMPLMANGKVNFRDVQKSCHKIFFK